MIGHALDRVAVLTPPDRLLADDAEGFSLILGPLILGHAATLAQGPHPIARSGVSMATPHESH